MEALHAIAAQKNVDLCIKAFKEHCSTKKLAKENLLLNPFFNQLIETVTNSQNHKVFEIVIEFLIRCLKSKTVSPLAMLALFQGQISKLKSCKTVVIPVLSRLASVLITLEREMECGLILQMAGSEPRIIPFILEEVLSGKFPKANATFFNFLLGDSELILNSSIIDDTHYKLSRIRLLTFLVQNVENEDFAEALTSYLVWNSGKFCLMEFDQIYPLLDFFSGLDSMSQAHLDLFQAFTESICDAYMKFGVLEPAIQKLCTSCSNFVSLELSFKIGCLAFLRNFFQPETIKSVLNLVQRFRELDSFGLVLCAKLFQTNRLDDNVIKIAQKFIKHCFSGELTEKNSLLECLSPPFTEFGYLINEALRNNEHCGKVSDLIKIYTEFPNIRNIDFSHYLSKGYFEFLFNLLLFAWGNCENSIVIEGLLSLLSVDCKEEDERLLRYSYVVDFLESNLDGTMFLNYLPLFCSKVNRGDNILFSFVQQKISSLLALKADLKVQYPILLSLRRLFESSQTRQSRLNFIATSVLSFLQGISNRSIIVVDTRSVYIAFDILTLLSDSSVIDPRDVWAKHVSFFVSDSSMWSNCIIRAGVIKFASAFKIIPEGKMFYIYLEFSFRP